MFVVTNHWTLKISVLWVNFSGAGVKILLTLYVNSSRRISDPLEKMIIIIIVVVIIISWMQLSLLPKIGTSFDIWNRFNISSRANLYPLINFYVDELVFLHNQNWPNSINWLCLFFRLFSKMYCLFDTEAFYDVIKFSSKNWRPKILNFEFLENKNSFWSDIKDVFPSFTKALF